MPIILNHREGNKPQLLVAFLGLFSNAGVSKAWDMLKYTL